MKLIAILALAITALASDVPKPPAASDNAAAAAQIHELDVARLKFREAQLEMQSLYTQQLDLQKQQQEAMANIQEAVTTLRALLKCDANAQMNVKTLTCEPGPVNAQAPPPAPAPKKVEAKK